MTLCIHKAHFLKDTVAFFLSFSVLFLHFSPLKGREKKTARETFSGEPNLNRQTLGIAYEAARDNEYMVSQ